MAHRPQRTCIGCKGLFAKDEVIRIVAGPDGPVVDYRERLPGRAAYLCPRRECFEQGARKEVLSRALRAKAPARDSDALTGMATAAIRDRILSLIGMAAKAGKLAAGHSAVEDALAKGRARLLLFSLDLSEGTKDRILRAGGRDVLRQMTLLTKEEAGLLLGRDAAGVLAVQDDGLADALWTEYERFKRLAKQG